MRHNLLWLRCFITKQLAECLILDGLDKCFKTWTQPLALPRLGWVKWGQVWSIWTQPLTRPPLGPVKSGPVSLFLIDDMGTLEVFDITGLIPRWHPLNSDEQTVGKWQIWGCFKHKKWRAKPLSMPLHQHPSGWVSHFWFPKIWKRIKT